MRVAVFNMKLSDTDQLLIGGLMAKHRLTERSVLMRRALAYYASAPVASDPVLDALEKLRSFIPTEEQSQRHQAAKARIEAGQRGLGKAASLALLDGLQEGGRGKVRSKG